MGSWNGTCMISNLPIECGDEVKLIFLHRPYFDGSLNSSAYCYPNGIFHIGALALDAKYNDYGSVDDIVEDVNYKLIEKYFKTKYKKIKVEGHVLKEFTLEEIIKGIERGKFEVFSEGDVERKKMAEKVLETYGDNDYGSKNEWEKIAKSDVSEMWRIPTYNFVLIRADVWNGICNEHKTEFWKDEKDRTSPDDYYQTAQGWVEKRFETFKNAFKDTPKSMRRWINPMSMAGYAGGNKLFMDEVYSDALNTKNLKFFQKLFTEITIIESFLSSTRKGWMIVSGAGSQSSEWESYQMLNKIVDSICVKKLKEYDDEY